MYKKCTFYINIENDYLLFGSEFEIKHLWDRYVKWLKINCPEALNTLKSGADKKDISKTEEELGVELPESLRDLLSIHDGQVDEGIGVIGNYYLLSLDEILYTQSTMKELLDNGDFEDFEPIEAIGPVKRDFWWNPKWISIATNGFGDDICIDLDPDIGGNVGQIITFWHDWEERKVIAKSLEEWFEEVLVKLENGTYRLIEDQGELMFNEDGFTE
ncbi:SMI1/KNR4 family protein [Priestia megaterium]|uniref:SMI1/KNR4 family protein n=1 Tax=Priestia megaterium TaxID=1404 RepID=UPI002B2535CE|nr:SMI1/KNR4 family protein [Priestia megaterium]MEB2266117.1 SMI1/KNR4 family protein [Priestia megaterium]